MAAAARERALRKRKGEIGLGEGKGAPEPSGESNRAHAFAGTRAPSPGLGARSVGGAEAVAARRSFASPAPPLVSAAAPGARGMRGLVPFIRV